MSLTKGASVPGTARRLATTVRQSRLAVAHMRMWMIVTVETELEWPTEETTVEFMGHSLVLRPPDGDSAPDVRLRYEHPQFERGAYETICRFLSTLSWWSRRSARARLRIACTAPIRGGKGAHWPSLCAGYSLPDFRVPAHSK